MPEFKDMNSLLKYIELNLPINLEKIGEEVKNVLRENVENLWYGRNYTPTHYTRTMEYIDSIQCSKARKIGGGYQIEIYFASDLILPHSPNGGEWGQHESVYGEDVSSAIPYYIEYGNNSPLFSYDGVRPVGVTKDWLNDTDYVKKRMRELLSKYGYII